MSTQNFSIEDLAVSLIDRLDRDNIFPPHFNNPEKLISSSNTFNGLSLRRPRRSPNAFLLCRKNVHQEAKRKGTCNMRVISKVTGILWRNASPEEKSIYERLADRVNELHCKRANIVSNTPPLTKVKETFNYKPYSIPAQLNPSINLLNTSLNSSHAHLTTPNTSNTPLTPLSTPLSLPISYPPSSISQVPLSNPPTTFVQKDDFFLNHFNPSPSDFNNQVILNSSNNNNHHHILSYLYNNYIASPPVSSHTFSNL
ncbi:hypothetical protein RclHR1_01520024 [Rhizophagus clarus]|uniref:HMG box domain-containing protein n=1 Tax=Rhizophagus clarus TaxID=94130 RepID=A0A2Z6QS14_9GLOM|nr:hypothetical protein RclHR1_01520024 [Rhizophagus clarus]GES78711.1 hypothetical protein GLOIN_2v1767610 [Rhizophagus clarus]